MLAIGGAYLQHENYDRDVYHYVYGAQLWIIGMMLIAA